MKRILILIILLSFGCKKHELDLNVLKNSSSSNVPNIGKILINYCYEGDYSNTEIGGGESYPILYQEGTVNISTHQEFMDFFDGDANGNIINYNPGDIVFINCDIYSDILYNMGMTFPILLPDDISIVSGRGTSNSYTIFDNYEYFSVFFLVSKKNNVNFSGLNAIGSRCNCVPNSNYFKISLNNSKRFIRIEDSYNVKVSNCDLSCFSYSAISINNPLSSDLLRNIEIGHNYIHSNQTRGLGYGILVDNAFVKVFKNLFSKNRHCIAGTGKADSGYDFSCNLITEDNTGVNVDMHGTNINTSNGGPEAGKLIFVHHNEFRDVGDFRISDPDILLRESDDCPEPSKFTANIGIRGKPTVMCFIANNIFYNSKSFSCQNQIFDPVSQSPIFDPKDGCISNYNYVSQPWSEKEFRGNIIAMNNIYGKDRFLGLYVPEYWDKLKNVNWFEIPSTLNYLMRFINDTADTDYSFGDFNGDGTTDIFKIEDGKWFTLPIDFDFNINWQYVQSSLVIIDSLHFGNFNSDNTTDLFYANGSQWKYSNGGFPSFSNWNNLSTSSTYKSQLQLGRFNTGNSNDYNINDIFFSNGSTFRVSVDGINSWNQINTSNANPLFLEVGDFSNNSSFSDVFYSPGNGYQFWDISILGNSNWMNWNSSGISRKDLYFGDINLDGKKDVFCIVNGQWCVSLNGNTSWIPLNISNFSLQSLPFGNW